MLAVRDRAQQLLLPAPAGVRGGTRSSASARPDFHRPSGVWQPPAPSGAPAGGGSGWPSGIRRLMRKLGLRAVRPKRNTSKPNPAHKVYPYLLRGKTIDQPNQVWATDITYIAMRQGFLYLVAIIDWATRRVLSWRLSNTRTAGFCVEALSEALARFGKPGIFNTDQGAQFTSDEFTTMLRDHGIEISMDGRGRCHDNIFVERLWWTVKHEWVYLRPAANGIEQKRSLAEFFDWYNLRRPHQALGWRTPDEAYLGQSMAATALAA